VVDWLHGLIDRKWDSVDAFFDWSFYSQGTRDHGNATSEFFLQEALRHFGDAAMADSGQPACSAST